MRNGSLKALKDRMHIALSHCGIGDARVVEDDSHVDQENALVLEILFSGCSLKFGIAQSLTKGTVNAREMRSVYREGIPRKVDVSIYLSRFGFSWEAYQFARIQKIQVLRVDEAMHVNWPAYISQLRLLKLNPIRARCEHIELCSQRNSDEPRSLSIDPEAVTEVSSARKIRWGDFVACLVRSEQISKELAAFAPDESRPDTRRLRLDTSFPLESYYCKHEESILALRALRLSLSIERLPRPPFAAIAPFIGADSLLPVCDPTLRLDDNVLVSLGTQSQSDSSAIDCSGHVVYDGKSASQ
jgi:hypothetical protein